MEEKKEEFEEVKFQEVEVGPKEIRTDSYFDGRILDYIGWRILAYLVTCVTFGIAAPWGKCMLYRYQFSHTVYNGKRLKFEGNGGDLFVKRLIWTFLTCITLGIYGWWVPAKKANWVISNLHFEDEEFVEGESFFEEKGIKLFWLNVLWRFLNIISVGLLIPFTMCMKLRYINRYAVINKKKLVFTGQGINLLGRYILWGFLTCITLGIYGWWVPVNMFKWEASYIHIKKVGEEYPKSNDKSIFLIIPIFFVGVGLIFGLFLLLGSIFSSFSLDGLFKYPINDTMNGWKYCEKGYAFSRMTGYSFGYCYKYDSNMTEEECDNADGMYSDYSNYGWSCKLTKDPKRTKEVIKWEKNHEELIKKQEATENSASITPPTSEPEETTSRCASGWYYSDYYGKCLKDLEHVTYEECEAKGGMFAGYDSCTIFE